MYRLVATLHSPSDNHIELTLVIHAVDLYELNRNKLNTNIRINVTFWLCDRTISQSSTIGLFIVKVNMQDI